MAPPPSSASDQPESAVAQSFEEGSSSEGTTGGYATPDEYALDEHEAASSRHPDEETREALREADELKTEGTDYFRAAMWTEALQSYRRGLARLPLRKDPPRTESVKGKNKVDTEGVSSKGGSLAGDDTLEQELPQAEPLSELDQECAKARSVLNGNIGACYVKLGEHKEAVKACARALLDDPQYVKALHRRATSNDLLGTWSSLVSAEEDYNSLVKILPPSSSLLPPVRQALHRITPRREAAQKAEMGEMMDKLKGLGNSVLGNFGLSTDNFKFEPNGQGGYSVNFVR